METLFDIHTFAPYALVSGVLFCCGVLTILTRRNAIYILLGVELILNASGLNFVAFSRFGGTPIDGQVFTIFIIILAASEAAVALAIVLQIFHHFRSIDLTETGTMKR